MATHEQVERDDPGFLSDLRGSHAATWAIAQWIWNKGDRTVEIGPKRERPSVSDRFSYADGGDLYVTYGGQRLRIEAKHRPRRDGEWRSATEFPYESIIVNVAHLIDNADPKAHAHVIANKWLTHAFIVLARTQDQWTRERRFDSNTQRERDFYFCPLELCNFVRLSKASTEEE